MRKDNIYSCNNWNWICRELTLFNARCLKKMLLTHSENKTKEETNNPMNTHDNELNSCIVSVKYYVKHKNIFNRRNCVPLNNWNKVKNACAHIVKSQNRKQLRQHFLCSFSKVQRRNKSFHEFLNGSLELVCLDWKEDDTSLIESSHALNILHSYRYLESDVIIYQSLSLSSVVK